MSENKKFTLQPGVIEAADAAIRMAETGDRDSIAIPPKGKSGVSIGPRQMDLGQNPALRENLIRFGVDKGVIAADKVDEVRSLFSEKYGSRLDPNSDKYDQTLTAKSEKAQKWAGKIMMRPGADNILREAEIKHLQENAKGVEALCKDAPEAAKDFCNSREGQIEMLGMRHQYGNQGDKAIKSVFTGEKVTIDIGGRKSTVQLEGKMDKEQFRKLIRDNTPYGADPKNRNGIEGRDRKMDKFYRDNKIDDGSKVKVNPPPKADEAKPGAPEARPETAQPDKHSALPADEADAPVQSAEAAPASVDENRFIVGWTTQPDMTSRPIWGNEAQYDAYKAQQAEAEAEAEAEAGAQAANDPEPAMPQSASLQQPATEQNTNLLATSALMPDERSSRGSKVWNPDSGALADAVMQARGTDLPIWTQMLLGRDAMTNGSRAAVKGLQNAINAATKLPGKTMIEGSLIACVGFSACAIRAARLEADSGSIGERRNKAGASRNPTRRAADFCVAEGVEGLARRTTTRRTLLLPAT